MCVPDWLLTSCIVSPPNIRQSTSFSVRLTSRRPSYSIFLVFPWLWGQVEAAVVRVYCVGGLPDKGLVNTRSSFISLATLQSSEKWRLKWVPPAQLVFRTFGCFAWKPFSQGGNMAFSFSSHVAGGHFFRSSNHQQLSGLCGNTWAVLCFNLLVIECRWVHLVKSEPKQRAAQEPPWWAPRGSLPTSLLPHISCCTTASA